MKVMQELVAYFDRKQQLTPKQLRGDNLRLTSAKWNGKLSLLVDLVNGRFQLLFSGALKRYLIPGLGIVDVVTDVKVKEKLAALDTTKDGTLDKAEVEAVKAAKKDKKDKENKEKVENKDGDKKEGEKKEGEKKEGEKKEGGVAK